VTPRSIAAGLSIAATLALVGCDRLPGRPDEAERYRRPAEVMDFASLYATNCSGCHGATGRLGPSRPLNDPVYLALVDREHVREVAARGVSGTHMPAFARDHGGSLTNAQVAALADGVFDAWADASKLADASLPPHRDNRGDVASGAVAYQSFCASCHGAEGAGGEKAGSIVDPSFLALVSDQMLRNSVIAGRPDLGMPDWRTVGERAMSAKEISDVVSWMTSKRRAVPVANR
jgi:mono/diheme cytochrome c family protein